MRSRIIACVAIVVVALALVAVWRPANGAAKAEVLGNPQARYVLTPVQSIVHESVGGGAVNTVIKMDSVTGETWVLTQNGWKALKTIP